MSISPELDKDLIASRFRKAIKSYDENAVVQREMADGLICSIKKYCGINFETILEIGCGTGILTKKIIKNFNFYTLYANDLVGEFENHLIENISKNIIFIPGDAEIMDCFPQNCDIIVSNSTFQWLGGIESFFARIERFLKTGGILAFTTFGPENFKEMSNVTGVKLNYPGFEEIENYCEKRFSMIFKESKIKKIRFDSFMSILKHIKATGSNGITRKRWTKSHIENFSLEYKKIYKEFSLTYNPCCFIMRKKCL